MSSDETVAVVVVTYNSELLLADLVASLERGLEGVPWHLTVADNSSADGTVVALSQLSPDATLVEMGRNGGPMPQASTPPWPPPARTRPSSC